jgi:hypothetical protein
VNKILLSLTALLSACAELRSEGLPIGTCVTHPYPRERWEAPALVYRVAEVGEHSYRMDVYIDGVWGPAALGFNKLEPVVVVPCPGESK